MINLLSPEEKKLFLKEQKRKLFLIVVLELIFFLLFILLLLLLIFFYFWGERRTQEFLIKEYERQKELGRFSKTVASLENYNQKMKIIDSFLSERKLLSIALNTILDILQPDGLYFTTLILQSSPRDQTIRAEIVGFSETRQSLLLFKNGLEQEKKIKRVTFSPESWITSKKINFKVSLEISNE